MSVKAFMCFLLRNLRSNPSCCVVNSNVYMATGSMTRPQHSFGAVFKESFVTVFFVHPVLDGLPILAIFG